MSKYPAFLSADPSGRLSKAQKSRARREASGVFSLFEPAQIQQFKEAFSLIDQDHDGMVSERDLKDIFASLGVTPTKQMLDGLLNDRPGAQKGDKSEDRGINFTMFLTMMGEHLFEFDPEPELLEAFECFDETDSGFVKCDDIRRWMAESGERMDTREIDRFLKPPFADRQGNFNYREWVKVLRVNAENEQAEP